MTTTIKAHAVRSGDWWAVTFDGPTGTFHTQAKRLDLVEGMVRDLLAMEGVNGFDVEVVPDVPAAAVIAEARSAAAAAASAAAVAAGKSRAGVSRLRAEGYTVRDIGALMGVSAQRVSQLAP